MLGGLKDKIGGAIGGAIGGGAALAPLGGKAAAGGAIAGALGSMLSPTPGIDHEYAKNFIRWRVKDAKKAGIHPLYALGAPAVGSSASVGASGDGILDGLRDVGSAASAIEQRKLQARANQRADAQADAEIAESRARARAADAQAYRDFVTTSLQASNLQRTAAKANVKQDIAQDITLPGGSKFTPGGASKTERVEEEYGGIASEVYGLSRLIEDTIGNYGPTVREEIDRGSKRLQKVDPPRSIRW